LWEDPGCPPDGGGHPSSSERRRRPTPLGLADDLVGEEDDVALDDLAGDEAHRFLVTGLAEEALARPERDRKIFSRSSSTRSCSISACRSRKLAGTTISPSSSCFSFATASTGSPLRTVAFGEAATGSTTARVRSLIRPLFASNVM
jgi:hypothetical protein